MSDPLNIPPLPREGDERRPFLIHEELAPPCPLSAQPPRDLQQTPQHSPTLRRDRHQERFNGRYLSEDSVSRRSSTGPTTPNSQRQQQTLFQSWNIDTCQHQCHNPRQYQQDLLYEHLPAHVPQRFYCGELYYLYREPSAAAFIEYYEGKAWKDEHGRHPRINWDSPVGVQWGYFVQGCREDGKPFVMCETCERFLTHLYRWGYASLRVHLSTSKHKAVFDAMMLEDTHNKGLRAYQRLVKKEMDPRMQWQDTNTPMFCLVGVAIILIFVYQTIRYAC